MTSKEAVDILWRYDVNFEPHPAEEVMHAIDIAIEALNAQPETHDKRTETHSCDLISRQDAIDALTEYGNGRSVYIGVEEAVRRIEQLTSAQPERKKGKWILGEIETGAFNVQYQWKRCSECGWKSSLVIPRNFCPNCGSDNRGE